MAARPQVVVFDYGSGNVHSAVKALERAGAEVELTAERQAVMDADINKLEGEGNPPAAAPAMNALVRSHCCAR